MDFTWQKILKQAKVELYANPTHVLLPVKRLMIYDHFYNTGNQHKYGKLAIASARSVAVLWQTKHTHLLSLDELLDLANDLLEGNMDQQFAERKARHAWADLDTFGDEEHLTMNEITEQEFYAAAAVIQALFEIAGRNPFGDTIITSDTTDADLDPWSADTALYSSIAWAGRDPNSLLENQKRLEFWLWWLDEAIPAAIAT